MSALARTGLSIGISNKKKADIDSLTDAINDAQYQVNQLQAVVDSMNIKSTEFSGFLTEADTNKQTALSNLTLVTDAVSSAKHMVAAATNAKTQTNTAKNGITSTAAQMALLVNKLILSVEVIDKLANIVNKQKLLNPIIPDELITLLTKATTDANNAVAMTLTALTSCYAAEATVIESKKITDLEYTQSRRLYKKMTIGARTRTEKLDSLTFVRNLGDTATGIQALLQHAYDQSITDYDEALTASNTATAQLEYAEGQLQHAITELGSLQAGLAAATAAAYAA